MAENKPYIPYVVCTATSTRKAAIYRNGVRVPLCEAVIRLNKLEKAARKTATAQAISTLSHPPDYDVF